jgi:hypothetical protein
LNRTIELQVPIEVDRKFETECIGKLFGEVIDTMEEIKDSYAHTLGVADDHPDAIDGMKAMMSDLLTMQEKAQTLFCACKWRVYKKFP